MNKRFLGWVIFALAGLTLAQSVSAGTVDINIWRFVTNSTGGVGTSTTYNFADANYPFLSSYRDGNIRVDFNISASAQDGAHGLLLDVNLVRKDSGGDINKVVFVDLNIGAYALAGRATNLCDSNNYYANTRVNCRIDLNIEKYFVAQQVADRNYDGNYFIRMAIYDVNAANQKPSAPNNDFNTASSIGIDNTPPNLWWDGNHATWQNTDANVHLSCTDYNTLGGDTNRAGCGTARFRIDTARTSTISMPAAFSDYNSGVDRNIFIGITDGNYALDWNISDLAGNKMTSSSTLSGLTDLNRTYVQIDETRPTVTITNTGGNSGSAIITSNSFTLIYSQSDGNGSGVGTYWIKTGSPDTNTNWVNNGSNTSYTYNLGSGTPLPFTITLYLKGTDLVDRNSGVVQYTILFESAGGGGGATETCGNGTCGSGETTANCPQDCAAVCGDLVCTGNESIATCPQDCAEGCGNTVCEATETCVICPIDCGICTFISTETIAEKSFEAQPTIVTISELLQEAGFTAGQIQEAITASEKVQIGRQVQVEKKTTANGVSLFEATITLSFLNTGTKELKNVKIVEMVPKGVASSASQIVSDLPFVILKEDPIVQFTISSIPANNGTASVSYSVSSPQEIQSSALDSFVPAVIASLQTGTAPPLACTTDSDCEDNNLCTYNRCVQNKCVSAAVENGISCGFGKECQNGLCQEKAAATPPSAGGELGIIPILAVVVVILVIGIYAVGRTRKKEAKTKKK